jgi:hypothetical protein
VNPYKSTREMVDGWLEFMRTLNVGMGGGMINVRDIEVANRVRDIELPEDLGQATLAFQRRLTDEILKEGVATGRDMPDLNDLFENGPWGSVNFCFPNHFLLPVYANMASYRVRPLGPETCLFELWSLTLFPEGEERPRVVAPTPIPYDDPSIPPIPTQDYSNIPAQQKGLHAQGFEYMRLSRDAEGLISHFHRIIDGYISGAPDEKLTKALRYVNTTIDSKIVDDIGL